MRIVSAFGLFTILIGSVMAGASPAPAAPNPRLMHPAELNEKAPESYRARFATSKGDFVVEVTRAWAPQGADRFYNLVNNGYFNDCRFFRVIQGFMVQFGINGDPAINSVWREARIPDDPAQQSNKRGFVTFGSVVEGMGVVDKLFGGYGEGAPQGHGPDQARTQTEGNAYLTKVFPKLDYIKTATIVNTAAK